MTRTNGRGSIKIRLRQLIFVLSLALGALYASLVISSELPVAKKATSPTVEQKVEILKDFFAKKLVQSDDLKVALPEAWIKGSADLQKAQSELESQLALLKEKKNRSASESTESEFLVYQIQFLKLSKEDREQLLSELELRRMSADSTQKGKESIRQATEEANQSEQIQKKLDQQAKRAVSDRESALINARLDLEKKNQALIELKLKLGKIQKGLSEQIAEWNQVESSASSLRSQDEKAIVKLLEKLRIRIFESNQRVRSRSSFHQMLLESIHLESIQFENPIGPSIEGDSEKLVKLIQELQKSEIEFRTARNILNKDRSRTAVDLLRWEREYRDRLLKTHGLVLVQSDADQLPITQKWEPIYLELVTIGSSLAFLAWSFSDVYLEQLDLKGRPLDQQVSAYSHLLKIALFFLVSIWLLIKKQKIVGWLEKSLRQRFYQFNRQWSHWLFEIIKDLYVFLVLLLMGTLMIDFGVGLGFGFMKSFRPAFEVTLIFFFAWGAIDLLRPLVSQRRFRFQAHSEEVDAMERIFEFIPKLILVFYLVNRLTQKMLAEWLNQNLIGSVFSTLLVWGFLGLLFVGVWLQRSAWRLIAQKAIRSESIERLLSQNQGKAWEPFILLFVGGLGVYFLAWRIAKRQLGELEIARSFQAMVSRALLERKKRSSIIYLRADQFPEGYLQCFSHETRARPEWHVARSESRALLQACYENWKSGKDGTTVLVAGDRGIGKSELIFEFLRAQGVQAKESKLKPGDSSAGDVYQTIWNQFHQETRDDCDARELEQSLLRMEPSVLLLENLENCILRQVGGFDTFQSIIDLIMRTSGRHLWLVTFTPFAWTVARRAVPGADCFSQYIYLKGMTEVEISEMILSRHRYKSDLAPDFSNLALESDSRRRAQISDEEQERRRRNLYFRMLWDYTGGNPRQALYFWKTSLTMTPTRAQANLFEIPEQGTLEGLEDKSLMLLAALVEHNGLTLEGMSAVLDESKETVRRWIEEITPYGIVYRFGTPGSAQEGWHLESFWINAVESYLEKRKFLFRGDLR